MRILVVGATGTIGRGVSEALADRGHEVLPVGLSRGDLTVDIADPAAIEALYATVGAVDAVVCTAGVAQFGALDDLTDEGFATSIGNKLMGQVNLVRSGLGIVADGGSFTLTSGGLSQEPGPGTAAVSMVGAAVEAFACAAAIDLEGRYRVNVVSPGWVAESRVKMGLEPMPGIWAKDLAAYYVDLVEGQQTGQILSAETAKA
ncbi:MAG: short chain dehydrogenase [Gemmatimonadota bacterium]|nr:short chain dehydrogenase [Gemmatimonadota bacterium]